MATGKKVEEQDITEPVPETPKAKGYNQETGEFTV